MQKKKKNIEYCKTKIIATIGPSSDSRTQLVKLIKNGVSVARLNFSHGSHAYFARIIGLIREISRNLNIPVAILQDLSGPKIRITELDKPVQLRASQTIRLAADSKIPADLYTDFEPLTRVLKADNKILIDDGYIELRVKKVYRNYLECKVITPGTVKSKKGINLPDISVAIPVFTKKDATDLHFGMQHDVDIVAMSFVETSENILPIKAIMQEYDNNIPVIAKIERPAALKNILSIMKTFDGIMIARGDLGVEVAPEKVPIIQKNLIKLAGQHNKPVITATQMLESMIHHPRPTRAETSDVSNAILDGSDMVMLSGETSVGKYPGKAVNMMRKVAHNTECSVLFQHNRKNNDKKINHTKAIVKSASEIARDLNAKYILVYTLSGNTALLLSKHRPKCPVFAFSPHKKTITKMNMYWGIHPCYIDFTQQTDDMIYAGESILKKSGILKTGDLVVTIAGVTRMKGATNMLRISRIK